MKTTINLTPHSIEVFSAEQFVALEQVNPTTWIADDIEGVPLAEYPSVGSLRIATSTIDAEDINGVPTVTTAYGELVGLPESYT